MAKRAIAVYPRAWRDRYEPEFVALLDAIEPGALRVLDIVRSGVRERTRDILQRVSREVVGASIRRAAGSARKGLLWFTFAFVACHIATALMDGMGSVGRGVSVDAIMGAGMAMLRVFLLARGPVAILAMFAQRARKPLTLDERWKAQWIFGALALVLDRAFVASLLPGMSQARLDEVFGAGADWFTMLPAFLPNWWQRTICRDSNQSSTQGHAS